MEEQRRHNKKRCKKARAAVAADDGNATIRDEDACVQTLAAALTQLDPELADDVFDGLLRLIADYVPYGVKTKVGAVVDSLVLSPALHSQICNWIIGDSCDELRLLFRATRDGFSAAKFHDLCDGEGPRTVTVARVNDIRDNSDDGQDERIVGGFTSIAWSKDNRYDWHSDTTAFLFCNRNDAERFEYFVIAGNSGEYAVIHREMSGPSFGFDLRLLYHDGVDNPEQSYCQAGDYRAEDGGEYGNDTLVGPHGKDGGSCWDFCANEIEVFAA